MRAPLFVALASLTAADLAAAPRYRMKMAAGDANQGVNLVSIVGNPAIQRGFVALSALKTAPKRVHLSTEPAQQVLTGPALVPDEEILRVDEQGKPYYISFSAQEISQIKRRYALNGYQKLSNHEHATPLDSIVFEESWIVRDSERDPAAVLGMDVPVGTWMLSGHIADAEFWANEVVSGNVTGFSIEGLFDLEEVTLAAVSAPKSPMKKNWLFAAVALLSSKLGIKLTKVELKNGDIVDVAEDGTVSQLDADGAITGPAPDGNYEPAEGEAFDVKDGKKVAAKAADPDPKVEATDEAVTAAQDLLKGITADTTAEEAKAILEKALKAVGGETAPEAKPKPEEVKAAAVPLFLESVEMADGGTFSYNPITRRLLDAAGAMVQTGEFACADGSYFRVNTEQYTYQISKEDFDKGQSASTQLAAALLQLSQTPDGERVLLSGQSAAGAQADAPKNWVTVALARAKELTTEPTE